MSGMDPTLRQKPLPTLPQRRRMVRERLNSSPGSPPARMRRLAQQRGHVKWCGPRSPTSTD
jgi:hypothetical protein